ncbi:hypothetical protein SAMN04489708_1811 [Paracidovorax cattleyae]|uniref:Uncharacterized protein n=1 Tax=Paracidovorax cattleyae TaxID=80868 RepID=A0A1H0WXN5_9BURK|nr:hypothetical protein SAMN04489708_1811 [Paracidovorax cattleyae]
MLKTFTFSPEFIKQKSFGAPPLRGQITFTHHPGNFRTIYILNMMRHQIAQIIVYSINTLPSHVFLQRKHPLDTEKFTA